MGGSAHNNPDPTKCIQDIADLQAIEIIGSVALHLMTCSAIWLGLDQNSQRKDLDEARKSISALAGLIKGAGPYLGEHHARPLREGLRSLQLAFREESSIVDPPGKGPGEEFTGPVLP